MDSAELQGKKDLVEVMASFQHASLEPDLRTIIKYVRQYLRKPDESLKRDAHGILSDLQRFYCRTSTAIPSNLENLFETVFGIGTELTTFGSCLGRVFNEGEQHLHALGGIGNSIIGLNYTFNALYNQYNRDTHPAAPTLPRKDNVFEFRPHA